LFSELQTRLANWYIQEYSHIPFAPSRPEDEVTMRQLYVVPKIVDKGQNPNEISEKQINTFNDFFKKEGSLCKQIFLLGEPGTGKSTFLQNLAIKWSEFHMQKNDIERYINDQIVANNKYTMNNEIIRSDVEHKHDETSGRDEIVGSSTSCDDGTSGDDGFQDKTTLEIIDVLFYVSLRDAHKYCDYVDIIKINCCDTYTEKMK